MKISSYLLSIFFLLSISQLNSHGFEPSTCVKTWDGFKCIEDISCNVSKHKKILSYNFSKSCLNSGYVRTAGKSVTNCYIKIQFTNPPSHQVSNDAILCTPAQEFYLPDSKGWVPACQLNLGDKLFSTSGEKIAITGLELILEPLTVYAFEEERYHNFFVGTYGILTHNTTLPWQCSVVFSLPFGAEGVAIGGKAGSYFGPVGMVGGAILGGLFCWVAEKHVNENKLHHYSSVFDLEVMDAYFKGSKSNNKLTSPVRVDGSGSFNEDPNNKKKPDDEHCVREFENKIPKMLPSERVATIRKEAERIAREKGFKKEERISRINQRIVYKDENSKRLYSVDTQHGRFEVHDRKGVHLKEVNFSFNKTKPADPSGKHNLMVK